jgi:hypothetical protein
MIGFRREDQPRVVAGEITITYRLWKRAKVKAGKTYATGFGGTLAIEDVQVLPAALIPQDDVPLTGLPDVAAIRALAGEHTGASVTGDTMLYRVQFRYVDDAPARPDPVADLGQIEQHLAHMDARSPRGPWTEDVLTMLGDAPHVPARVLAANLNWERLDFKAHVRKLKALGLTISHEVGYELSPLGRRYLERRRGAKRR